MARLSSSRTASTPSTPATPPCVSSTAKPPSIPAPTPSPTANPTAVKGGHQPALSGDPLKPQGFNKNQAEADPFYKWSSLRSEYLGEANLSLAEQYAAYPGFYPGWYWAG